MFQGFKGFGGFGVWGFRVRVAGLGGLAAGSSRAHSAVKGLGFRV